MPYTDTQLAQLAQLAHTDEPALIVKLDRMSTHRMPTDAEIADLLFQLAPTNDDALIALLYWLPGREQIRDAGDDQALDDQALATPIDPT